MVFYHKIKRIEFLNRVVPLLLQNENGPCPLLALCNVLLLRGTISIHEDISEISSLTLVELIANHLIESNPTLENAEMRENQEKAINDVISILPSLQYGLDVNVKFSGVTNFEFNKEISIFDMLNVNLYHGWVCDPEAVDSYDTIKELSYNQLVEKVISGDCLIEKLTPADKDNEEDGKGAQVAASEDKTEAVSANLNDLTEEEQALMKTSETCKNFLNLNASQLTYHGLLTLYKTVGERQLCVFFRNNHFSTMFKINDDLYLLVTDQGYQYQNTIAWEKLTDIDGNTEMVSPIFDDPNAYLVPYSTTGAEAGSGNDNQTDMMLAMQLQREEELRSQEEAPPRQQQRRATTTAQQRRTEDRKSSNCILS